MQYNHRGCASNFEFLLKDRACKQNLRETTTSVGNWKDKFVISRLYRLLKKQNRILLVHSWRFTTEHTMKFLQESKYIFDSPGIFCLPQRLNFAQQKLHLLGLFTDPIPSKSLLGQKKSSVHKNINLRNYCWLAYDSERVFVTGKIYLSDSTHMWHPATKTSRLHIFSKRRKNKIYSLILASNTLDSIKKTI